MRISKREIMAFFLGIVFMLAIDLVLNWDSVKQGFMDGYNAGTESSR